MSAGVPPRVLSDQAARNVAVIGAGVLKGDTWCDLTLLSLNTVYAREYLTQETGRAL